MANQNMHVLLTNDDGIHAEGLWAVAEELQKDPRVTCLDIIAVSYTHLTLPTILRV